MFYIPLIYTLYKLLQIEPIIITIIIIIIDKMASLAVKKVDSNIIGELNTSNISVNLFEDQILNGSIKRYKSQTIYHLCQGDKCLQT